MLTELTEILCLLALTIAASGQSENYLKEKPDFFKNCMSQDPQFNECYRDNIQALIWNFRFGIPGLNAVGKFEPVRIKRLRMEQNQLKVEMRNITIRGLGNTKVIDARLSPKDFHFKLKVFVPEMRVDAKYKTSGNIMFLPINGGGKMLLESGNITLHISVYIKLRFDNNMTFADIQNIRTRIKNIESFHVQLDNLFNGNKMLEEHTNEIFNENWRDIVDIMRPTLQEGIDAIVLSRFKKIFNYIPASYLISDVPTAPPTTATAAAATTEAVIIPAINSQNK